MQSVQGSLAVEASFQPPSPLIITNNDCSTLKSEAEEWIIPELQTQPESAGAGSVCVSAPQPQLRPWDTHLGSQIKREPPSPAHSFPTYDLPDLALSGPNILDPSADFAAAAADFAAAAADFGPDEVERSSSEVVKSERKEHALPKETEDFPSTSGFIDDEGLEYDIVKTETTVQSMPVPVYRINQQQRHSLRRPYLRKLERSCWQCSTIVRTYKELEKHVTFEHPGTNAYHCILCGCSFPRIQRFRVHKCPKQLKEEPQSINQVPASKDKQKKGEKTASALLRFPCGQCDRKFKFMHCLQAHALTHSGERPHMCTICGKAFALPTNLQTHKRIHTGEKPYKCTQCGKSFADASNFCAHKRVHSAARPFVCSLCGEAFKHRGSIRAHAAVHSGNYPFLCEICGQRFTHISHLHSHVQSHAGKQRFTCDVCGKMYSHKGNLRQHIMSHTEH